MPTENVEIKFGNNNFDDILPIVIKRLDNLTNKERALCFIDPFGYKYSKPETLKNLLANGKTEIILFIPICFMHRFSSKTIKDDEFKEKEGKHIDEFISTLFDQDIPDVSNQVNFIKSIQNQFKLYLGIPFVDVMFIEKGKGQFYSLFFFSNNKKGFEKMLEAKWNVDEQNGQGFRIKDIGSRNSLFEQIDFDDFSYVLYQEIAKRGKMSNEDIYNFGLLNNHLPKHSNNVLTQLFKSNKIKRISETGETSQHNYIGNDGKIVYFLPNI